MTDRTSLDISGPPENFREVGRNLPGTQIVIKKANETDDDGKNDDIQDRFAIEEEISSWDTLKTPNRRPRPSMARDFCIQVTMGK